MERRHDVKAVDSRAALGFLARRLKILAMLDQFGAERAYRAVFLDRIAVRHIDRHRHAVTACREGKALPMIAARRRNDPGVFGRSRFRRSR